jgi:lactocepin
LKFKLRKTKKYVAVGLASLLTVSGSVTGVAGIAKAEAVNFDELIQLQDAVQRSVTPTQEYNDNEIVRVIVELEGAPAISQAIQKGVRYKDLPETEKQELQSEVKTEQSYFLTDVKAESINFDVENTFTTVVNGVSGEIAYGQIDELEKLPNVAAINIVNEYERPTEKPEMITSKEMVQAIQTWNAGFDGKGMVVGIIDTGIDYTHKDMVLNADPARKLTQSKVNETITQHSLPGQYYTLKVPYGYNYADKNSTVLDLGPDASMHGMHVAGTVGANGDEANGGIKGVAPEAQLLALKVFGNDPQMPSTWGDIYIKAIDDGIKLGADVLNMSLGSTAGSVQPNSIEQQAIERAVNSGVLMSISAGNSNQIGSGFLNPLASNPDIGLVGSPSVSTSSTSVASIENTHIQLDQMIVKIGTETIPVAFKRQSSPNPIEVFGTTTEKDVVYVGDGAPSQYVGKDVTGKVAFAVRSNTNPNYGEIQKAAEAAGAVGVIIRGTAAHGDYVSMALLSPTIPLVSLGVSDGTMLETKIKAAGGVGKVTFNGKTQAVVSNTSGKMSTFSSWGVTPTLELKPEISAPGGQIYSTFNDNKYGLMSGTSMAAPHLSGGSALVLQRVQQLWPGLTGADKVKRAKAILMNTAKLVLDPENNNNYYSPRRQGAGNMQLHNAIATPVYVVRKGTQDAKVELKEITTDKFDMTLTATNFSGQEASYTVNTSVLTDAIASGRNALKTQSITDAVVTTDTPTVRLLPGESKDITVSVDLTNAKAALEAAMKNGYFVEGFITLTNTSQDVVLPNLSVPFVGFKGDWNAAPNLDPMVYDAGSYFQMTHPIYSSLVDQDGWDLGFNPFTGKLEKNKVAISPNGDGVNDAVSPLLIFLRNSKTVEYSITDATGKTLRTLRVDRDQRKNYYAAKVPYSWKPSFTEWDGLLNNKLAADGQYFYTIKTQNELPGKPQQVVSYPVVLDNTLPVVSGVAYSKVNNTVAFLATDSNGSGLDKIEIYVDGVKKGTVNPSGKTDFQVPLGTINVVNNVTVTAYDNAGNKTSVTVTAPGDNTVPFITSDSPISTGIYDTLEIPVRGSIKDGSRVATLKVRSAKMVGESKTLNPVYNNVTKTYDFNTQITFIEDGVHDVFIEGTDVVGNKIEFRREIYIDTNAAGLQITGLPANNFVATGTTDPVVSVNITDNFDDFRLVVNGSEVDHNDFDEPYQQRALNVTKNVTLPLNQGRNDFKFEVTDLSGHKTTQTVSIYKGDVVVPFITAFNVTPATNVSVNTPAAITAEASESIVWEAKVMDPDGNVIDLPSSEGTTYAATFTPDQLAASGQYTLVIAPAGGTDADKIITHLYVQNDPISVEEVSTYNANGDQTTSFDTSSSVSIKANLKNLSQTVATSTVLVQVRDAAGAVAYIGEVNVDAINKGALNRLGVDIPLAGFESGSYTVEVLVWDNLLNALPLAESSKVGSFTVN